MRAYLRETSDEEFRQRYDGVGAGTTGARRVVVERGEASPGGASGAARRPTPTKPSTRFSSAETARTQPQVDRLKQQARDATRNVRIESTDSSAVTGRQSIDQEFAGSYAKAGLQPTGLVGANSANGQRKKYEQPDQITRRVEKEYRREQKRAAKPAKSKMIRIKKKKKSDSLVGDAMARFRATRTNIWITSWGLWWWWCLQVPLAFLLLIALGLAGGAAAVDDYLSFDEGDGIWYWAAKPFELYGEYTAWLYGEIFGLLGFDFSFFSPEVLATSMYTLAFLFGLMALFSMYLMYAFSRIDPVGGKGAAIKKGAIIIALCGYAIPIANILPWFLIWAVAVWFYPK